uniref:Ribosome-binding factor A n=1 Tax=Tetradesmus obliquus TaxID=3088 RepID=A0A383V7W2_TETOB|eukprot:jgi/Sobl393_1/3033/SZX61053.1
MRSLLGLAASSQLCLQSHLFSNLGAWGRSNSSSTVSSSSSSSSYGGSGSTSSSSNSQAVPDPSAPDQLPADSDSYYWVPHDPEAFTPASVAQRRAAGRLETAIESVMLADAAIREHLVERYGLTIHRIELAKDRRTVFILWDAHQGKAKACEQALEKHAFRLRRDLAKNMKSKHTPFLEFRHNHLPPLKAAVAATMEQVEAEAAAEAAAAAAAAAAGQGGSNGDAAAAAGPAAEDVAAAIARLEEVTKPVRAWH